MKVFRQILQITLRELVKGGRRSIATMNLGLHQKGCTLPLIILKHFYKLTGKEIFPI